MRRRSIRFALLAVLVAAHAGCLINERTGAFRCELDTDCDADRRCQEGFCTVGPRAPVDAAQNLADAPPSFDAPPPPPDAFVCPDECSTCEGTTCLFDCSEVSSCAEPIVCPPGLPCEVSCTGPSSCMTTIDCSDAAACTVTCGGTDACSDAISCPASRRCSVTCSEANTCAAGVECANSCECDVTCGGAGSCATAASCPAPTSQCNDGNNGCTSAQNPCRDPCL